VVEARPIGILGMSDEKGRDDKVISVSHRDPRMADVNSIDDLADHLRKEIYHFFEVYKELEDKQVNVLGWESADVARDLILKFRLP
jgi:inorganic pyrophosphatase